MTAHTNLVFVRRERTNIDGPALRRRYVRLLDAAGLGSHDLRHTFGSLAINVVSIVQVQVRTGRADVETIDALPPPQEPGGRCPPSARCDVADGSPPAVPARHQSKW